MHWTRTVSGIWEAPVKCLFTVKRERGAGRASQIFCGCRGWAAKGAFRSCRSTSRTQYHITLKKNVPDFPKSKIQREQATISPAPATPEPMQGRLARPACSHPLIETVPFLPWV